MISQVIKLFMPHQCSYGVDAALRPLCFDCLRRDRRTCHHWRRVSGYTVCPYCGFTVGVRVDGQLVRHECGSGSVPKRSNSGTKANVCPASEKTPLEADALWKKAVAEKPDSIIRTRG